MYGTFRKLFVIYSLFSSLPLFANEDYPDWMRQLEENYHFRRVVIAREAVEKALPDDHKSFTHGLSYGARGAYGGRALAHRRATKRPLAEPDLHVLAQFWAEQRERGPHGHSPLPFVEIMETYRLTGLHDAPLDRNPEDLCVAFQICPSRNQLDTYLLLLNCFIQLKATKPPAKILFVLSKLEKLTHPQLVEVSEDPSLLETWFEGNKSRFEVLMEEYDEAIDDPADEEVSRIDDAARGGGGGMRRTPSFDDLAAVLSQAQAEAAAAAVVPAFLPELSGKKKGKGK